MAVMLLITKKIGGSSARHFIRQQQALGKEEGFIEEMMNGQKVVKVFCHEEESKADFDKINDMLFTESETANKYANTLGPILNNIGNVLYVVVALAGGLLLLSGVPNLSISGLASEHQRGGALPEYDQAVCRRNRPGFPSDQRGGHGHRRRGADFRFAGPAAGSRQRLCDPGPGPGGKRNAGGNQERTHMWAWKHPHRRMEPSPIPV